jgi:nucleotide-binding universal stress UspA family protein
VTAPAVAVADLRLRRILCAVSPRASSRHAVERAAWLGKACDAEVRLFHALERHPDADTRPGAAIEQDCLLETLLLHTRHLPGRVRVSSAVAVGASDVEIRRHAALMRADLIVVAVPRLDRPTLLRLADLVEATEQPVFVPAVPERGSSTAPIARLLCERPLHAWSASALTYARALASRIGAAVAVCDGSPAWWQAGDEDVVVAPARGGSFGGGVAAIAGGPRAVPSLLLTPQMSR